MTRKENISIPQAAVKVRRFVLAASNTRESYLLSYSEANRRQLVREHGDNQARIPTFTEPFAAQVADLHRVKPLLLA